MLDRGSISITTMYYFITITILYYILQLQCIPTPARYVRLRLYTYAYVHI